jgi:hypothetical protein
VHRRRPAKYRHDSGAPTRVIDQLAERGLLERVRRDRRKMELQLTLGRDTIEGLIPLVVEKLNLALGDFSGAEVHEFRRLLGKLNRRVLATVEPAKTPARADTKTHARPHRTVFVAMLLAGCVSHVRSPFAPAPSLARCYLLFYGATSRFAKRSHQLGVVRTTVAGEGERGIVG